MDITVTFRHMEPTESLRTYAEEKVSKINKYLDFPVEAHIVLTVEKFRHVADVTLSLNGTMVKGVEETEDMYSAIDHVMDKIEIQVKRLRSKERSRRVDSKKGDDALETETEGPSGPSAEEPGIVVEKLDAKPMAPGEAAMRRNMMSQDFLVFRNSRSREINVLYKRRDGNLGLIEPSA